MAKSLVDAPVQVGRLAYIDPRTYGAVGDGVHNDTAAIQEALNVAGTAGFPNIVQLSAGKYLVTTVLKFTNDSTILQGTGCGGYQTGSSNDKSAVLIANNTTVHDSTPIIRCDPSDGSISGGWIHACIRDISIDVTASSIFSTSSTSPPVIQLNSISNCPVFKNIFIIGHTGTALALANGSTPVTAENCQFVNMLFFGGYNSSGGSAGILPTAPGVTIAGCDNMTFRGGIIVFNNTSIPLNANTSDMAAIQLIPALGTGGGIEPISNGFQIYGTIFTRYACTIRLSSALNGGQWYGAQNVRIIGIASETYGRFIVVNEEGGVPFSFFRTQVEVDHCFVSGPFGGSASRIFTGDHMIDSFLRFQFLGQASDITLGSDTYGVVYEFSVNPNFPGAGTVYAPSDSGQNARHVQILTTRSSPSGTAGQLNQIVYDATNSKLWICTTEGPAGTAVWKGVIVI